MGSDSSDYAGDQNPEQGKQSQWGKQWGKTEDKKNAGPSSSARNICVQCVCGNPVSLDNPYSPATLQPQNMNFTANSQQLEGKAPTDCTTPQTMDSQTALWDRTPRQHHKVHKDSET